MESTWRATFDFWPQDDHSLWQEFLFMIIQKDKAKASQPIKGFAEN